MTRRTASGYGAMLAFATNRATVAELRDTVAVMSTVAQVLQTLRDEASRLRGELAGVDRAIRALEDATGVEREVAPTLVTPPGEAAPAVARPYASLPFFEAVQLYLSTADGPKHSKEIAAALRAGGFSTRAKDFDASVRTMLRRSGQVNDLEPLDDYKWQLRAKGR